ncbi:hypothetical protein LCM20_13440 [Halobacillus litoralis]|uniref:DUF6199 family natural product biosynthesis protein n=1 Tax=Halobacillus litoralis TaxID=45668 RepID=UPI001CD2E624|nr:DUF6199 family natural product biosynthesis protein [Halobacillus litoralis]MCA0971605.1 hypothetical protein [Halobacillus litoralis]
MSIFIGSVLLLAGFVFVKFPTFFWYITVGWKLQDAEPSGIALGFNKVIGYLIIITGVGYLLDFFFPGTGG